MATQKSTSKSKKKSQIGAKGKSTPRRDELRKSATWIVKLIGFLTPWLIYFLSSLR